MTVSYSWLCMTIPLTIAGLWAVVVAIRRLRASYQSHVARVPMSDSQEVLLESKGPMLLHGDGPFGPGSFSGVDFRLTSLEAGRVVPLAKPWFESSYYGISRSRLSLRSFEIDVPGRYRLDIRGSGAAAMYDQDSIEIVITRDDRGKIAWTLVALILGASGLLIGLGSTLAISLL